MLNVKDDQLVVDAKGIYSVEKVLGGTSPYVLAGLHAQNGP